MFSTDFYGAFVSKNVERFQETFEDKLCTLGSPVKTAVLQKNYRYRLKLFQVVFKVTNNVR